MSINPSECGEVQEAELPAFLALMTDAFSLEAEGAARVFYNDPYFSLQNKRVLRHHGDIVSILTLVEREACLHDHLFPVVGLCGIATLPQQQRQGFATTLIQETLELLRLRQVPFVLLNPIEAGYYRRLGWEYVVFSERLLTTPTQLAVTSEISQVCTLSRRDLHALSLFYDETNPTDSFSLVRDTKRWDFLMDYLQSGVVFRPNNSAPEGYLIYERAESLLANGATAFVLKVQEFRTNTDRARRGLLSFLAQQPVDLIQFEGQCGDALENGLLTLPPLLTETEHSDKADVRSLPHIEHQPTVMARIADFEAALRTWRPPQDLLPVRAEIRCILEDAQHPQGRQEALLAPGSASPLESKLPSSSLPTLTADVSVWTRVLLGAVSGEDVLALGIMKASDKTAHHAATQLFPLNRPFLSPLDYF